MKNNICARTHEWQHLPVTLITKIANKLLKVPSLSFYFSWHSHKIICYKNSLLHINRVHQFYLELVGSVIICGKPRHTKSSCHLFFWKLHSCIDLHSIQCLSIYKNIVKAVRLHLTKTYFIQILECQYVRFLEHESVHVCVWVREREYLFVSICTYKSDFFNFFSSEV